MLNKSNSYRNPSYAVLHNEELTEARRAREKTVCTFSYTMNTVHIVVDSFGYSLFELPSLLLCLTDDVFCASFGV